MADEPLGVTALTTIARTYGADLFGADFHQSYIVPGRRAERLQAALFYCDAGVVEARKGYKIWPPEYLLFMDIASGKVLEFSAVAPRDFGLDHSPDDPIGEYLAPPQRLDPAFLTKLAQMYQIYDQLIAAYAKRRGPPSSAAEFLGLFDEVSEKPLWPYYEFVARDFFTWLGRDGR